MCNSRCQAEEDDIKRAFKLARTFDCEPRLAIEPSAAVGVAVALCPTFKQMYPAVQHVAIVLCGGNVDPATVDAIYGDVV